MTTFQIIQNDTSPPIQSRLTDNGEPIDLSTASNITFHMEDKFARTVVDADLTGRVSIIDEVSGKVEYVWKDGVTSDTGKYTAEWQVLYDDGGIETFPTGNTLTVEILEEIQ